MNPEQGGGRRLVGPDEGRVGIEPKRRGALNGPEPLDRGVLIVGSGLLGTSLGMALRSAGVAVHLRDTDDTALKEAVRMGAGTSDGPTRPVALGVVAVPPASTGSVVAGLLDSGVAEYVTDVASVKELPAREVRTLAAEPGRYVGSHPMAGREVSGPTAALADLFEGRPWVLCPDDRTDAQAVTRALAVAQTVGAAPVTMPADEHDAAVALVSHAPHVVAALMAAQLSGAPDHEVRLAGQGVTDVTRVAAGDPSLWAQILGANAEAVAGVLGKLRSGLDTVLDALSSGSGEALRDVLAAGVTGRGRLPGKHGAAPVPYATVAVVLADEPGQLAALFADAARAGVNIEDVRIDHRPGQPAGLVELDVRVDAEATLARALRGQGWTVHE
ncbi:MAG TPA: prephenate dehydrogenase [Jiangellaceae bacterium]